MSNRPKVLMQTGLKLSGEREEAMMDWLKKQRERIRKQMGWDVDNKPSEDTWVEKRSMAWAEYENDFTHRRNAKRYGPLYRHFNSSVNVPKRAIRVFKAQACEDLLNSDPFCGFLPEGEEDEDPAIKLADRYHNRKLKDSQMQEALRLGVEKCAVGGEGIMKITLKADPNDEAEEDEEQQIWVDAEGNPLKDVRGQWVYQTEEWEPDSVELGLEQLKRDPSVKKGEGFALSEEKFPVQKSSTRKLLDTTGLSYQDFWCDLTEEDIHKADVIGHDFDMSVDELWEYVEGAKLTPEVKQWLEDLKNRSGESVSAGGQPVERRGEQERGGDASPKLHLSETWYRFDCHDRGKSDELCCLWETASGRPIYYEYTRKASPTGKRPFEVIRIIPIHGRWYGMGFYELLSNEHNFIDRQWNRIDARNSASGRFTWARRGAIVEVDMGIPFELNSPRVWTIHESVDDPRKAFGYVELPKMDEGIWQMLMQALQQAQLMSGTMLPGDAAASNLNSSETLGEQQMLAAESKLLSNDVTQDLKGGILCVLKQAVIATFRNYDDEEANLLLGADNGQKLTTWAEQHKPQHLLYSLRLLMTKAKNQLKAQKVDDNVKAVELVVGAGVPWRQLVMEDPAAAERYKPLYLAVLDGFDIPNADKVLEVPPPQLLPQPALSNGQPATAQITAGSAGALPAPSFPAQAAA